MSEERRVVSRSDWALAGALAAVAVLLAVLLWSGPAGRSVTIRHEGEIVGEYSLAEDRDISIHGAYDITFRISDGGIFVLESTCPNGQCIAQGTVQREGDAIVCVPNQVSAYVEGTAGTQGVDAATG